MGCPGWTCSALVLAAAAAALDVPLPDLSTAQPQVRDAILTRRDAILAAPDDGEAWGRLATVLHAHDCAGEAQAAYARAQILAPEEFRWPYFHAILEERRAPARALLLLDSALEIDPRYVPALVRRGRLLEALDRSDAAYSAYDRAATLDPSHPEARFHRGVAALERGDHRRALTDLEAALARRPGTAAILSALARAYQRSGEPARARETAAAARAATGPPQFEDPLFAEVQRDAVNLRAYVQRTEALERAGRLDEAASQIEEALAANPDHLLLHVALNDVYMRQKHHEKAIEAARTVLASGIDVPNLHKSLAICLLDLGRLDEAEGEARLALQENPLDPEVHQVLGRTMARTGRPDEAIAWLTRALDARPDDDAARLLLAGLLLEQARPVEAAGLLRDLADARPGHAEAWSLLGVALLRDERADEAADALRRARDLAPDDVVLIRRLSAAFAAAGRYRDQLGLLDEAHRRFPRSWDIAHDLAWVLATSPNPGVRDAERAVALAERLAADPERTAAALDTLAAAYAEAGRFEDALRTIDEAFAHADETQRSEAEYTERRSLYATGRPYRSE